MSFRYEKLDEDDKEKVKDRIEEPVAAPDYTTFLQAWEEEHYSHSVLCQQLKDAGEHGTGPCVHETAMSTIEESILAVRAGGTPPA